MGNRTYHLDRESVGTPAASKQVVLEGKLRIARLALVFYADPKNYQGFAMGSEWVAAVEMDGGNKAVTALELTE